MGKREDLQAKLKAEEEFLEKCKIEKIEIKLKMNNINNKIKNCNDVIDNINRDIKLLDFEKIEKILIEKDISFDELLKALRKQPAENVKKEELYESMEYNNRLVDNGAFN